MAAVPLTLKMYLIFLINQMVNAGFHYDPCQDQLDRVSCATCSIVLEGWEDGDDPLQEHVNRRPTCPYLKYIHNQTETNTKNTVNDAIKPEIELVSLNFKDLDAHMPTIEERMMTVEEYVKYQQEAAKKKYIQESEKILSHIMSQGFGLF